jgi:hypothetical protein
MLPMRNEFTEVIERDGEWFVSWSPEIPGAKGRAAPSRSVAPASTPPFD